MNKSGRWMYNKFGNEYWNGEDYETESEALEAAFNDEDFVKENSHKNEQDYMLWVSIGQISQPTICIDLDIADQVVESIQSTHYDEYGEYAESYLDHVSTEQMKELNENLKKVIEGWADKHNLQPRHYLITETSEDHYVIEDGNALKWSKESEESDGKY